MGVKIKHFFSWCLKLVYPVDYFVLLFRFLLAYISFGGVCEVGVYCSCWRGMCVAAGGRGGEKLFKNTQPSLLRIVWPVCFVHGC